MKISKSFFVALIFLILLAFVRNGFERAWSHEIKPLKSTEKIAYLSQNDIDEVVPKPPGVNISYAHILNHSPLNSPLNSALKGGSKSSLNGNSSGNENSSSGEEHDQPREQRHCHEDEHEHGADHDHEHESSLGDPDQKNVNMGMILILDHLGLAELAANLLWVQMDEDSHKGLWHRVNFYLDLIPRIDPHFIEAWLLKAYILDQVNKLHDESLALLEKATEHNPMSWEIHQQIGVQAFNFKNFHGPKRDLKKALEHFTMVSEFSNRPDYIDNFIAYTLAALGKRAEAIEYLQNRLKGQISEDNKRFVQQALKRVNSNENF
ncbi:MAG: hypothetical protein HQM08_29575 [Candidatus Riflebacteria bacterium]|nr:hypothetical protein [Candidatus Riflebacteria bacterium]